jgi:predicted GIY-YIG superfamily endonuclease
MNYFFVYVLQSEKNTTKFYTGITSDLEARLTKHNSGSNPATKLNRPWRIKTYIAFTDEMQAREFEKYLKSPSGRAFAKKRL